MSADVESKTVADAELETRVRSFLCQQGIARVRSLRIEANQGVVTLHGNVGMFHDRQLCVSRSKRVAGVVRVVDNLTVDLPRRPR